MIGSDGTKEWMVRDDERDLEQLGDEITSLSAHLSAATCRWLGLVGEFDAREGWAAWGCRSCAHWVAWRCSMAPGAAREHVRVARGLRQLPLIEAAFARGELSFSKVRALTRVEDVEREEELLELALRSTAAQLERIVRGYRQVLLTEAGRTHEERFLSVLHDDDGSVVIRGRLPREDGAVVLKALEIARELLGATVGASMQAAGAGIGPDDQVVSPGEDAEGVEGVEDVPAETPSPAERRERGAQNADALVALADAALAAGEAADRTGGDRFQVVVHVDADVLAAPCTDDPGGTQDIPAGRCGLQDGAPLAAETVRRLCCDAAVVSVTERAGRTLSVGRKTRSIPPALRRALDARDGGCRFPGCTQHRFVDAHHIEHWAHGGETKLTNLVQLCRHHHRLLHEGGFTVERLRGNASGPADLVFRRPDGRRLRSAPRPPRGDVRRLRDAHDRLGLRITPETPVPEWYGDRLDLPSAVDALLAAAAAP